MSAQKRRLREFTRAVEARGHEVLRVEWGSGGHGKMWVRLSCGREGKLALPSSPSSGERITLALLMMHLRALERGPVTGSRDGA